MVTEPKLSTVVVVVIIIIIIIIINFNFFVFNSWKLYTLGYK